MAKLAAWQQLFGLKIDRNQFGDYLFILFAIGACFLKIRSHQLTSIVS